MFAEARHSAFRDAWGAAPRRIVHLLAAGLAVAALATSPPSNAGAASNGPPAWLRAAVADLARMPVRPPGSMATYRRTKFGAAWQDVDGNHCDTRNDILRRDLTRVVLKPRSSCVVQSGVLRDPYTGRTIAFVRGPDTSGAVQIDHVVSLADAWRTGAAAWTAGARLRYANDPFVLLAVDGPANEAKGDADAAEWLPRAAFRCRYVAKQVAVKTHYRLWTTAAEHAAMKKVLASCD